MRTTRLGASDKELARTMFAMMAVVFGEPFEPLSDGYLERLLSREEFWAIAALEGGTVVGGVTAHTLPMTTSESSEVFIYDIAVRQDQQRQGIGRLLMAALGDAAAAAGIDEMFVPADDDDEHALDFYRALGGSPSPVTFFTFSGSGPSVA